jgi:DNA modification methylase
MLELNKIYCMDNILGMSQLDDSIIDLTVTSPPYDDLRKYNGFSFNFESVVKQLFRVTKNNGVVVWVVGDQTKDFKESLSSFKQAIYFTEIGFGLLDTMIYHKPTIPPHIQP